MTRKEILIVARALISDPHNWTQHAYARTKTNNVISPQDPSAVCFCAVGALERASGRQHVYHDLADALVVVTGDDYFSIFDVNDGDVEINGMNPHEAVLHLFDIAIERA